MLTLFLLLYVYGGYNYLVNLKVVSKTTKRCDFYLILSVFFQKCTMILPNFYRDFLTALIMVQWLCGIYAVDRRVLKEDRGPMNADYRHYKVDHKNVHCFALYSKTDIQLRHPIMNTVFCVE